LASIKQLLQTTGSQLNAHSCSARADAEALLCHVLGCTRAQLYGWPENIVDATAQQRIEALLALRIAGSPIAYLTGQREFWSLALNVTPATLIPRPETELLVAQVLQKFAHTALDVLDLGTGSGAIAIALAHERPQWRITATDISTQALAVARANSERYQCANLHLCHSDWFSALYDQQFDVIVSNPPYVAAHDPHLAQGDVRFEPATALVSGADGMDAIRVIIAQARAYLRTGGALFIEHGYDQQAAVRACLENHGYNNIEQFLDLSGQPRLSAARNNGTA
jgi:release factor glutamine methyltransferase